MLADQRFDQILTLLKDHGFRTSQSLAAELEVSEVTIRRDLAHLDKQGRIKRVHGGARILHQPENGAQLRAALHAEEKRAIGEAAADLVQNGETIFIDTGSTMLEFAYALQTRGLQQLRVVTHAVSISHALIYHGISVLQLGGEIYQGTDAVVGQHALRLLESMRFDRCFLGAAAVNLEFGISDRNFPEVDIKRAAMQHSSWTGLLADASKWDAQAMLRVASLRDIHCFVTDHRLPLEVQQTLLGRGLSVIRAEP